MLGQYNIRFRRCPLYGRLRKGTWVRLFHPPVEEKLIQRFEGLDVGDRVRVQLIGTDVERGLIDFSGTAHLTDSALNRFIHS